MTSNVVVTIDVPRTGGATAGGRATGRRTAIGCSGGGVTTGGLVGGGVLGGFGTGGVGRTGGVDLATTTATGVDRATGGGVRTGVGFGGGEGGGVGLGLVGVGDGLGVGRHEPSRTSRKSTFNPIPPVGGPVAGITSTRTLAPGELPIETHTSTFVPGVCLPPAPDPAHATPAGAANKAPAPTTHPQRRARPHALMRTIIRQN
ncbi:hypothetical protein [Embleya sp. NPDC005575]|uniref:hypothetical protein n=1 Tax=Embleya sp. NPDC005575 TaxID=3156892 RepID=UPI0033ABC30D